MDNHIRNPDIHLTGSSNISASEIHQSILENLLSFVHSRVVSDFYHSIVDLPHIDFMYDFVCCFATGAAILCLVACELFSVGRCVEDMENVSEHWSSWHLNPVQLFAGS